MTRERLQRIVVWAAAALLSAATIALFGARGGPWMARPATIVEHVTPYEHETRDLVLLAPKVETLIPRGAAVTVFRPRGGRAHDDHANYLAGVGLFPRQNVLPPFIASRETRREDLAEWVIAVGDPFEHPHYRLIAEFPEGRLYRVDR